MPYRLSSTPLDLTQLSLRDVLELGERLRNFNGPGTRPMEEVAQTLAAGFCEALRGSDNQKQCALARIFITQRVSDLPDELANKLPGGREQHPAHTRCLVLIGTTGEEPQWNSRHQSAGHQVIPLASEAVVARAPMIANLFRQFGVEISELIKPQPETLLVPDRSFNIFHVEEARGSSIIPAQDEFVVPYGIRTVIGFGGLLPEGELFAVVLFLKVHVSREIAAMFSKIALNVRMVLLPHTYRVFAPNQAQ